MQQPWYDITMKIQVLAMHENMVKTILNNSVQVAFNISMQ